MHNKLLLPLIAAVLGFQYGSAAAQQLPGGGETTIAKQVSPDKNAPLLMQADDLIYDNQNNRVIARKNVEIYYNNYTLLADEVIYDRNANTLSAVGNVRIKEPDGSLINADRITLTDNFRDGFIRSLRVVTHEDARIAAANAYRKDGDTTVFESGVFTPCKVCTTQPDKPPLWRVKAKRVIHNKAEKNIYYEDASFELFGVPVFWMPYFYHPDPTVKRRSGFLMPTFNSSDNLGFSFGIPYYYNPSPHYDVTLKPTVTSKAGILVEGGYRQRLENGQFRVDVAGAFDDDAAPGKEEFRGSFQTQGDISLGSYWNWGWDATIESDDTFRRFYKMDSIYATDRVSKLYLTGQGDRNYFNATMYHFGGLTRYDDDASDAVVHPVIDYNYVFDRPVMGGELTFDLNALSLSRDSSVSVVDKAFPAESTSRIVAEVGWRRTVTDPLGQRVTPFFNARGDVYKVSEFEEVNGVEGDDDLLTRQLVTGGIDYRYPFVKNTATASHVLEPIGQIITRPDSANNDEVPNEDAQSLVFDDTLLFDIDKFSGYDRIETGTRANIGMQYTMQTYGGVSVRMVGGQSYHIAGDNAYSEYVGSGLSNDRSDYVVGGYVDYRNYVRLVSQLRLDEEDLSVERQDLKLGVNVGVFQGALSYVSVNAQPDLGFEEEREEVAAFAAFKLSEKWTLFGDIRYDISNDDVIRDSIGLQYSDECFTLSVTYAETFIEDDDIEPDQSVMLRIGLKYLGETIGHEPIGALSPEASVTK